MAEINCEAHLRCLKAEARKEERKRIKDLSKLNALAKRLSSKGNFVQQPSSVTQDKKKIRSIQQTICRKYYKIKKIGHGAFGEAFTVKSLDDGDDETFVMKTEKLETQMRRKRMDEIEALKKCHHPNIVQYIDHFF